MSADSTEEVLRRAAEELRNAHGMALGALDASLQGLEGGAESISLAHQHGANLAAKYAACARRLDTGRAAASNVRLPMKVRPMSGEGSITSAVQRQRTAEDALRRAIDAYESASTPASDSVSDGSPEFAGRRTTATTSPTQARPTLADKASALNTRARGSVKGSRRLLSTWILVAVPIGVVGMLLLSPVPGIVVGVAVALAISGCLVSIRGATWASSTKMARSAGTSWAPTARAGDDHILERARERGEITGFEPDSLQHVQISRLPLMHGSPGSGLATAEFGKGTTQAGIIGEQNFAKALAKAKILQRFATFWSLHMLTQDTYGREESDIDCAIVTGRTIWLVDVKFYASGNVWYRSNDSWLYIIDAPSGKRIKQPIRMSRNMEMGVDRFRSRYFNYKSFDLQARVVFMPTQRGAGQIQGVEWPGRIPAQTLTDFLAELEDEPPFEHSLEADLVVRTFKGLLKG